MRFIPNKFLEGVKYVGTAIIVTGLLTIFFGSAEIRGDAYLVVGIGFALLLIGSLEMRGKENE